MRHYSIEPRLKEYVKGYGFLSFMQNPTDKHKENVGYCHKNRTRCCKNCFQNTSPKNYQRKLQEAELLKKL